MRISPTLLSGACACLFGASLLAHAQTSTHQNPTYQNPTHQHSSPQSSSHQSSPHQSPTHQSPTHRNPTHQNSSHQHASDQRSTEQTFQAYGDAVVDPAVVRAQARDIAEGDPARWYRVDDTPEARLRTLRKEIGAALNEASNACKKGPTSERTACMQQARSIYKRDMAQAMAKVNAQKQAP
jgi:hypothetical protein